MAVPRPGTKRLVQAGVLLAASSALALVVAELVLRAIVGPPVHWRHPQELYVPDAELGFQLAPRQEAFTHDQPVHTNALGLRGEEVAPVPHPGVRRILALGDSQTFGNGLAHGDTWPAQLERELAARGGAWQVVNAGIPATDTWQHARLLERLSRELAYDLVLLALYPNDVTPLPAHGAGALGPVDPAPWRTRLVHRLKRSALLTALWQARRPLRALLDPGADAAGGREARILSGEPDPTVEAGWQQVERSLAAARETARAEGAELRLLVIPRRDQVSGANSHTAYNVRATEIADRLGVPVMDALPVLREAWQAHGDALFIPWDGHNGALANRAFAEAVAQALLERAAP